MPFSDEQIMLTLAGLTYRGFADVLHDDAHDGRVAAAVDAGLQDLAPVRGEWDLVWGPATSHETGEIVDSSAVYVARHRREGARYVVAIRGTNPISLSDWQFGDLWVNTTVPWPYAPAGAGAVVSASTALGLGVLQALRWRPSVTPAAGVLASIVAHTAKMLRRVGAAAPRGAETLLAGLRAQLRARATDLLTDWEQQASGRAGLEAVLRFLAAARRHPPEIRRPRPRPAGPQGDTDLLTFLASAAAAPGPALDVTVTGHSKGAALAQAVALWLREALDSPAERWDAGRGARVHCYAFAGPTPGNAAFAQRFEGLLGATHHHVRNVHDIVTHAWQPDELRQIPALYGSRTALFTPVIDAIVAATEPLGYRHVQPGVRQIAGPLLASRSFVEEFIHQHLEAYLHELGLDAHGVDALRLFVG